MSRSLIALILSGLMTSPAVAVTQANVPVGGTMASSCSGRQFAGLPNMGSEIVPTVERSCNTSISSAGIPLTASTSDSGTLGTGDNAHFYTNNSSVAAAVGAVSLYAENKGSSATAFSGAQAMGGWTDGITIAGPSNGTGIWVIPVSLLGTLSSTGMTAMTQFEIYAFKDNANPSIHTNATAENLFKALNTPLATGDANAYSENQAKSFRQIDTGSPDFVNVSQTLYFAIPFVYDVEFKLGIFGVVSAGESTNGPFIAENVGVVSATVSWAGPGYIVASDGTGQSATPTITSRSGYNYNAVAEVPESATWMMLILGFGVMGVALRTRRHIGYAVHLGMA
jgi:hypothetical protein